MLRLKFDEAIRLTGGQAIAQKRRDQQRSRQRRTGWLILTISVIYILYFLKARLFAGGVPIMTKEWVYFVLSLVGIMIGTINIRMADMRERNQQTMHRSLHRC